MNTQEQTNEEAKIRRPSKLAMKLSRMEKIAHERADCVAVPQTMDMAAIITRLSRKLALADYRIQEAREVATQAQDEGRDKLQAVALQTLSYWRGYRSSLFDSAALLLDPSEYLRFYEYGRVDHNAIRAAANGVKASGEGV